MARDFDLILYGASGFTGQLVAEYLAARPGEPLRWAMAGRNLARLAAVRDAVGAPADIALLAVEADDPAALKAMADRTEVVLSTVGPYQLYGSPLVEACVASGTGYVDLCGEPGWMREMIDALESRARASGARIVFSCGFDSIPFDSGVERLQALCIDRWGRPASRIKGRVVAMRGGFSGGTAASLKATLAAAAAHPSLLKLLASSFALTPGFEGPQQPRMSLPYHDESIDAWVAPFIMAPINTKNVHRTNLLLGHRYGADFRYDEMVVVPGLGEIGRAAAEALAKVNPLASDKLKPGDGPSREEREKGHYKVLFVAEDETHGRLALSVSGDRDPGYGSTSRMIAETAICLAKDADRRPGIWTPAALMGGTLVDRLQTHAGLVFAEDVVAV